MMVCFNFFRNEEEPKKVEEPKKAKPKVAAATKALTDTTEGEKQAKKNAIKELVSKALSSV